MVTRTGGEGKELRFVGGELHPKKREPFYKLRLRRNRAKERHWVISSFLLPTLRTLAFSLVRHTGGQAYDRQSIFRASFLGG